MSQEFDANTEAKIKPNFALQEPPLFRVIYMNDEVTTMEFVVDSLCEFFSLIRTPLVRLQQTFMPMVVLL